MCMIVDANQFGDFANRDIASPGMERLREWIEKRGKVVYPTSGKYADEIRKHDKARNNLKEYIRTDRAKIVDRRACENTARKFSRRVAKSDDAHILALAVVADTNLLCTDNEGLKDDLKRLIRGGKIYPNSKKAQ